MPDDPGIWRRMTFAAVADALGACDPRLIRALAVSGTSATLLAVDPQGTALSPAMLYDDARAVEEARTIRRFAPATSAAHGPSSALAKWLWLKNRGLPPRARPACQSDWISGQFLGRFGLSDENNALKLGYDPIARRWPDWMREAGMDAQEFPTVSPAGNQLGRIAAPIAQRFGLSEELRIVAGTTDSIAAFIASGADRPGTAVSSLGSTLVLKLLTLRPVFSAAHGIYSHRLGASWLAGGASNSGGAVLRAHFSDEEIELYSRSIDPQSSSGLDYYPLLQPGERFPIADPGWPPRMQPQPAEPVRFLHGLLEGIAYIERQGYETLSAHGAGYPEQVLSVGKGAANAAWTAMRSRILGVPVLPARNTEAAYGAALLARHGYKDPFAS